ncbi:MULTISPECIES: hypothetical protein [unclassified Aureispira]|uniref:hypothetical protein n=1 Tax=unclassified Aureispira TaxID=2649989 RepID=UPI0006974270|nr:MULTISPECIES: hypothetical protein [unclassified Aureispira]WMX12486.1 hypothetical protein QP953_16780 [Aureispira sp. CCB-E]
MKWTRLEKISYLLVAVLVLCIPAFYNGFPFRFPDTTGYLTSGFENKIGDARAWLYAGFIRHVSLWETLWFVVFAQGLLITGTIYLLFKYFFRHKYKREFAIVYVILAGLTTAISFHVSMLMPDIFTPIVILSFGLLLLGKELSQRDKILTVFLFVGATAMHNSHLVLNLGILILIGLTMLVKPWRVQWNSWGVNGRKLVLLIGLIFFTHLSVCTLHYSKGGEFKATRGGTIFLFARLCDFGIAQSYLEEHCKDSEDAICSHVQTLKLGRGFLWMWQSYLYKSGGWTKEGEAYYGELVKDILTTPKYLKKYIIKSTEAMFMQFFYYEVDPLSEMRNKVKDSGLIKTYFETYDLAAVHSRQFKKTYSNTFIERQNAVQQFVIAIAMILLVLLFWDKKYSKQQKALTVFIVLGLFVNAFIAGATSGVYDRYQSRVAWLLTLPAFWYLCAKIETFGKMLSISKDTTIEKDAS